MTEDGCADAEFFERLFRKLLEDAVEAYHRTPVHISSRPYIERILRLAQSGLSEAEALRRRLCASPERR